MVSSERRFACTACGKCCTGWLPLTLDEALAHAGRFPLALVWTPLRQGAKAFAATARIGFELLTRQKKRLAVRVTPTAYIPPSMACPALSSDGLCTIHDAKPLRCRAMPLFAYRDEADQADLLIPRPGWACDVSDQAPVVYRDKTIIVRDAFDAERQALLAQAPALRRYAEAMRASVPSLDLTLAEAAAKPGGGHVVMGLASLLRTLEGADRQRLALAQRAVLAQFVQREVPAEYRRHYDDWAWELERFT